MINRLKTPALLLGLAVMALGVPASAQSIKVPKDHDTIQEAVDAASAGDTIVVSAGTYVENVVIGASLDGLTILGKGKCYVDGFMGGDGITINTSNVTLKNLIIRHAGDAGVSASALVEGGPALTGITLDKLTIINSEDDGILLNADGVNVINCSLNGCDGGIDINGVGATVQKCEVRNDADAGIDVFGAGAMIMQNTVAIIEDETGIYVSGNAATVDRNNISSVCGSLIEINGDNAMVTRNNGYNADDYGIDISGNTATVDKNNISGTCSSLIYVSGDNASVTRNKVEGSGDYGIDISGMTPVVSKNTVTDIGDDSSCIYVSTNSTSATIEMNRVSNAFSYGYEIYADDATIRKNQAIDCGSEDEGGFYIQGNDNTIENNKASGCDANGFEIQGNTNELTKNMAKDCTVNGIWIISDPFVEGGGGTSTSNRLTSNTCINNQGQGLNNEGFGTIIEKNRLSKNRQDLTNAESNGATYIDNGGNKFQTGGLMTEPDIQE